MASRTIESDHFGEFAIGALVYLLPGDLHVTATSFGLFD